MAMLEFLTALSLATAGLGSSTVIDATAQLDTAAELALPAAPSLADLIRAQVAPEILQGFDTILLTQINAIFGSESLPLASGGPVEPGIYVTVSPQQLLVFDAKVSDMKDGLVPPGPASRECKSGCKALLWSGFRQVWLRSLEEAQAYALEVPVRVLFAVEASVPAQTLVELAYAAGETRPGDPPSFSLLVNGSNAGLRARSFHLLPPGGLRVSPGDNVLGLRVALGPGESFTISAAHPRFAGNIEGTGWKLLASELAKIKKRYPNKETLIIDVGEQASVGDVVMAMVAAQQHFPETVLTDGLPVKWG
ncbi:MAG: hypothetical protein R6X02_29425 [Enhygromyxa sp.]